MFSNKKKLFINFPFELKNYPKYIQMHTIINRDNYLCFLG